MDAGAPADDLFELGHGANLPVDDDEAAGLGIHAGGKQPRGGDYNRVTAFGVDEVIQLRHPCGVIPGDPHDVAWVFLHEFFVFIDQSFAHPQGVLGIDTENHGLLVGIA